jgi:ABC-type Fe3+-hydroxamate transport system substrate-binding protein
MPSRNPLQDLTWLAPFLSIGFITLALLRPAPVFPVPANSRTITDGGGFKVAIAQPFRGSVASGVGGYLENTRAPDTLRYVGSPDERDWFTNEVMYWIYPEVEKNDRIWDKNIIPYGHGPFEEVEHLLALDGGVYLGYGGGFGTLPFLRRLGQPAVAVNLPHAANWDAQCFMAIRVETAVIGRSDIGEAMIVRYREAFADLANELHPETLASRPRIVIMGSDAKNWQWLYVKNKKNPAQLYLPPAGVTNAADASVRQSPDAERVLMLDPDYIFLMGWGEKPEEFIRDPRWLGLKAVKAKRIYTMPGRDPGGGGLDGIIFQPLWTRWMAEIVHPHRLAPKLREMTRARLLTEFNYRLSDAQIDELLRLKDNSGSAGYARFARNDLARNLPKSAANGSPSQ